MLRVILKSFHMLIALSHFMEQYEHLNISDFEDKLDSILIGTRLYVFKLFETTIILIENC